MRPSTSAATRRVVLPCTAAFLVAIGTPPQRAAAAWSDECLDLMPRRQAAGLDPFAPPCNDEDLIGKGQASGLPPVRPIFLAKQAVEMLLENEDLFRNSVRLSQRPPNLDTPPEIQPSLFERLAAERIGAADAEAFRAAARSYVRAAYDANELITFAYRGRAERRSSDAQINEYVDGALAACRRCKDALSTMVALLPKEDIARAGPPN